MNMNSKIIRPARYIAVAAVMGILFLFGGCGGDSDYDDSGIGLALSQSGTIHIESSGGTKTIVVTAKSSWNSHFVENDDSWLTFERISGNVFSLTARENTLQMDRVAKLKVYLEDNSLSEEIDIIQPQRKQTITITPLSLLRVPAAGRDYNIYVSGIELVNLSYAKENDEAWVVIAGTGIVNGMLKITLSANTGERRSENIVFSDLNGYAPDVTLSITQLGVDEEDVIDPLKNGYTLMSSMRADQSLVGKPWGDVNNYMKQYGWDYSEHPNNPADGKGEDHTSVPHMEVLLDGELNQYVFNILSHANANALDGDRGTSVGSDRQRNEMKSVTNSNAWNKMNGNYGEWQVLEWKMKIPVGFQPSPQFTHLHQLKGVEGTNIGSPVLTLSVRANSNGSARRFEINHVGRSNATTKGRIVDNVPLENFEGEWVQVQEEVHYNLHGYYRIIIMRLSDGAILMEHEDTDIDTWRDGGCTAIRNKYGIYRSFSATMTSPASRPQNGIKDENIWLGDFKVYEKNFNNTNPVAVND